MDKINVDPELGFEFQDFSVFLDGFAAGVIAGIEAAKKRRLQQVARKSQEAPKKPPKE